MEKKEGEQKEGCACREMRGKSWRRDDAHPLKLFLTSLHDVCVAVCMLRPGVHLHTHLSSLLTH